MDNAFSAQRPVLMGTEWMITADHPLAARAGAEALAAGGNAIDAAVAANLVLCVVRPHMCGPGGDLFALVYDAGTGRLEALNASGRSGNSADLEAFAARGLQAIPATGILTFTVPGAVAGWAAALERHGSMGLDSLAAAAIGYAEKGFPVYPELRQIILAKADDLAQSPEALRVLMPGGEAPKVGTLLKQPDLGKTLRLIAEQGPDALYRGELGEKLADFSREQGGFIGSEDLAANRPTWGEAIKVGYRGYEIASHPPNSQGIALLMQAGILENFPVSGWPAFHPDLIHTMVEAKKLAFADRNRYVCDPDFHHVPVGRMLDKASAAQRAKFIDPARAMASAEPRRFTTGGTDTVYLAAVDATGNAVSWIQSIYQPFGSCVMLPGTGMILQNRGLGFSLDPKHPNRLEPGKRPYHTLHPALILKHGLPYMVLGTPGADGQTQSIMQIASHLLDFGADVQQAVEAPRWRSEPNGELVMETRFAQATREELAKRGHAVRASQGFDGLMGSSQAILIDRAQGVLQAGADPRRQAYAIGK